MKKNNKITIVLIIAVLVIWGAIAYALFFKNIVEENVCSLPVVPLEVHKETLKGKAIYVPLKLNYVDPFLKGIKTIKSLNNSVQKEKMSFPKTVYKGFIGKPGNITFYSVVVNGKEQLMKKNDVFQQVKLLKGNANEIIVMYRKNKKTIELQ